MTCGPIETPQASLSNDEKELCRWIAEQSRTGTGRIRYTDAQTALGMRAIELTETLRRMRERLDAIGTMVKSPIVHTTAPYFDISTRAACIWDDYCRRLAKPAGSQEALAGTDDGTRYC
jgi:hypothetical protein